MNTSGINRSYMEKNKNIDEFIEVVVKAFEMEFNEKVYLNLKEDLFTIEMNHYKVEMARELMEEIKSPYGIDRYILKEFIEQGFDLDINRSQYIQYCFGIYKDREVIRI